MTTPAAPPLNVPARQPCPRCGDVHKTSAALTECAQNPPGGPTAITVPGKGGRK
jgi:hypothetical protein